LAAYTGSVITQIERLIDLTGAGCVPFHHGRPFGKGYLPSSVLRRIAASRINREISHKAKKASTLF
ncbi:hypothetical protein QUH41_26510, partial [Klebsiella grimontii]|uniref:hypothetical protein n=1 Tax=Klebsiella grimontii TaxID=2058152 RepID=UPI0025A2B0C7